MAAVFLCAALGACATSGALRNGRLAEQRQDYDTAVIEYTRALQLDPNSTDARTALGRAKLRAALEHFTRGRRLSATGRMEEALVELQIASEMNPVSTEIEAELRTTRNQLRTKVARDGRTELETLIDRTRDLPTPGLEFPTGLPLPTTLSFRESNSRDVIMALARFAQVNVVFDAAFRGVPITVELRNQTFEQALALVASATQTFFQVTAPGTIAVIPDTPAKRREYLEEVVRTFYLSNADIKETMDLLRIVIDARRIASIAATNAITIQDTPERIAAASKLITAIDKARPEVIIDVELLEVNRSRLLEYGLQIASPESPGINGAIDVNRPGLTVEDLQNLGQGQMFVTGVPGLYYRLLKTDAATRILANPQLRASVGTSAQARFGERVPVPVTIFAPLATGGAAQQPITSFNYENIGVNIDITPRTHLDDEVTLALKVAVSSISGEGFGGLPTFGNREISTVIRLKDGETNMLAGLIRDDERRTLDGIPGLSDLPLIGRMFAHSRTEGQQMDVILTLTPHIIRVLDLSEDDLRSFRVGGDGSAVGTQLPLGDLPPPLTPNAPTAPLPPAPLPPAPPPGAAPSQPILPPAQPILPPAQPD